MSDQRYRLLHAVLLHAVTLLLALALAWYVLSPRSCDTDAECAATPPCVLTPGCDGGPINQPYSWLP